MAAACSWPADAVVAAASVVAAVAGLLAAEVAAAAAVVVAAAGSVASGSVAAGLGLARVAADPGERAACAKSHDLTAGLTKDSAKLDL